METFFQVNPKIEKMIPSILHKTSSRQKTINACSCTAMKEKKTNFYEVLSLQSKNVGFDEIKKAYRNMALQYHPDVCRPSEKEESTNRFIELRKAYETLSDPISRRLYDHELDLVSSIGFGVEVRMEESINNFPKVVWEKQLFGLTQRSHVRLKRKNETYM